jgi:hypothetical protein
MCLKNKIMAVMKPWDKSIPGFTKLPGNGCAPRFDYRHEKKNKLKFHSSSPSQVEVHQLIGKQMYHHRLKEHGIGLNIFILWWICSFQSLVDALQTRKKANRKEHCR